MFLCYVLNRKKCMHVYMLVMLLINISVLFEEIRIVFKTKSIESFEIDTDFLIHCCFNIFQ